MRAKTGSMQFGDDWPGVFIRGDNALGYAACLQHLRLASRDIPFEILMQAQSLEDLLFSCRASAATPQRMKEYWMCARGPCFACVHLDRYAPHATIPPACNNPDSPRFRQCIGSGDGCGEWEGS